MTDTPSSAKQTDQVTPRSPHAAGAGARLARRLGLRLVAAEDLTIARRLNGRGFAYSHADGRLIRDRALIARLSKLAVPPAYVAARYCPDPRGHLQAIWRDAAGRLQYRYHPEWDEVRAQRRLLRLAGLTRTLPRIRRAVARCLATGKPSRELALAAVIELVAISGIRAGRESYVRSSGTRGAATLLKSNVTLDGNKIVLSFHAKGGKPIRKELHSRRLAAAMRTLGRLPGRRIFQHRNGNGEIRSVRAREVNEFLRDLAGVPVSLKDFRTLIASAAALDVLARTEPANSATRRRRQVRAAMQTVADQLGNTPAVCRKSYVPAGLVAAFERGSLRRKPGHRRAVGGKLLAALLTRPARAPRPPDLQSQLEHSVRRLGRGPRGRRQRAA